MIGRSSGYGSCPWAGVAQEKLEHMTGVQFMLSSCSD